MKEEAMKIHYYNIAFYLKYLNSKCLGSFTKLWQYSLYS